jgi:hypothetical protein
LVFQKTNSIAALRDWSGGTYSTILIFHRDIFFQRYVLMEKLLD